MIYTLGVVRIGRKIEEGQRNDRAVKGAVDQLLEYGRINSGPFRSQEGMRVSDEGLLYRKRAIIVPHRMQDDITDFAHRLTHAGVERNYQYIRQHFFWPGMRKYIERCCNSCPVCLENKRTSRKREPLQPIGTEVPEPRSVISADVATLPWSEGGYRYMLVIVDLFSKFAEVIAMRDQSAKSICDALETGWFYRHGIPRVLLTDQGKNVDGKAVRDLCEQLGIEKRHSSANHPQGDGQAERTVESIKQTLRCLLAEHNPPKSHWSTILHQVAFSKNSLVNTSTRLTPHELMYGTRLRTPLDQFYPEIGQTRERPRGNRVIWEEANNNIAGAQVPMKDNYESNTSTSPTVAVPGQRVMLKHFTREDGLEPLYRGPYSVIEVKHPNVKLDKDNGRYNWVHLNNNCKILPASVSEQLAAQQDSPQPDQPSTTPEHIAETMNARRPFRVNNQKRRLGPHPL